MLKRVLFLLTIGMLLLTLWPACAQGGEESSNEGIYPANFKGAAFGQPAKTIGNEQEQKPVINKFTADPPTYKEGVAPRFICDVSNATSVTITAQDGSVVYTATNKSDGKGVFPAGFVGAATGKPSHIINRGASSETQTFTLTAINDVGQASAKCSITVVPNPLTPSTK